MSTVIIESLTVTSVTEAVRLLAAQLEDHRIELPELRLREAVRELVTRPELGRVFLLRLGDAAVGVAVLSFTWTLEHGGKVAWLEELYVCPEARGRGHGQRLLDHALFAPREAGCVAVDLEVDHEHQRAEAMYARAGFVRRLRSRWSLPFTGSF